MTNDDPRWPRCAPKGPARVLAAVNAAYDRCDQRQAEMDAQTRMEIAAPAMLAALRGLIRAGSFHDDGTFVIEADASDSAITTVLSAIAAAEGRV